MIVAVGLSNHTTTSTQLGNLTSVSLSTYFFISLANFSQQQHVNWVSMRKCFQLPNWVFEKITTETPLNSKVHRIFRIVVVRAGRHKRHECISSKRISNSLMLNEGKKRKMLRGRSFRFYCIKKIGMLRYLFEFRLNRKWWRDSGNT